MKLFAIWKLRQKLKAEAFDDFIKKIASVVFLMRSSNKYICFSKCISSLWQFPGEIYK